MKRSARIALTACVVWVVLIWCIWLIGDFYGGETQVAMLAGLGIILIIKLIFGHVIDKKTIIDKESKT